MGTYKEMDIHIDESIVKYAEDITSAYEEDILLNVDSIFATLDRVSKSIALTSYKRVTGEYPAPHNEWVANKMATQVKYRLIKKLNEMVDHALALEQYGKEMGCN